MRLEDIVVATADGPDPLNASDHGLVGGRGRGQLALRANWASSGSVAYDVISMTTSAASMRASAPLSSAQ